MHGLYPDDEVPYPCGALAIAVAAVGFRYFLLHFFLCWIQVERALTLWKDGNISVERITESRLPKGSLKLKEVRNKVTGVSSTRGLAFSDSNWGNTVRWWLANIQKTEKARPKNLQAILKAAQQFERISAPQQGTSHSASSSSRAGKERALLPESDEDDDGNAEDGFDELE